MGNKEAILLEKPEKYFKDLNSLLRTNVIQNQQGNANDLNEKINLNISILNTEKNYCYQVEIFTLIQASSNPLQKSEVIDSQELTKINFDTKFAIQYFFEKEQKLNIKVYKTKSGCDPIELSIQTTLGCIMGSRRNTLEKDLIQTGGGEKIVVVGEKIKGNDNEILFIKFNITSNVDVDFKEIKNKIIYIISANGQKVYKSECINDRGKFQDIKIPLYLLSDKKVNLKFIDCKKNIVGDFDLISYKDLLAENNKEGTSHFTVKMSDRRHLLVTPYSIITKNYTFIDYLKAGVQIGLNIAIDYTGSNGDPKDYDSLHFVNGNQPNQYEQAIFACGSIVAYYDYDQLFPVFGFGAVINGKINHCFNVNMQQDPNIHFIQNIIQCYHQSLSQVILAGPTNFSPVLKATINMIRAENNNSKYVILMIITDGLIDDMDETIDYLVEGSKLPLSVIIIGVGDADFSNMEFLDSDDKPLTNSIGENSARDLVQFVPFYKFGNNPERLAQEVLAEIPRQIIEFYEQQNITPESIQVQNYGGYNSINLPEM